MGGVSPRPWKGTAHPSVWGQEAEAAEAFRVPSPEKTLVLTPTPQRNAQQGLFSLATQGFLAC